jgi:hypothetical protein
MKERTLEDVQNEIHARMTQGEQRHRDRGESAEDKAKRLERNQRQRERKREQRKP